MSAYLSVLGIGVPRGERRHGPLGLRATTIHLHANTAWPVPLDERLHRGLYGGAHRSAALLLSGPHNVLTPTALMV